MQKNFRKKIFPLFPEKSKYSHSIYAEGGIGIIRIVPGT